MVVTALRTRLEGLYLGTDATGSVAVPNRNGVVVRVTASELRIGGTTPGAGNLISGNLVNGVLVELFTAGQQATNTLIDGNQIGTDRTGTAAVGNQTGIYLRGGVDTVVGGTTVAARNVISGNASDGIDAGGGDGAIIQGNYIGTDVTGTQALGNTRGVRLFSGATNLLVGGSTAGAGNVISGNQEFGVYFAGGDNVVVEGNYIGTNASQATPIGNGSGQGPEGGVYLTGATGNLIGGTSVAARNLIAFNHGPGVLVGSDDSTGNAILGNAIFSNDGLGIDLGVTGAANAPDGVTPNDVDDPDVGPNQYQNYPQLTSVFAAPSAATRFIGRLNSVPNTAYRVEFFTSAVCDPSGYGEGGGKVAHIDVTTDGAGWVNFDQTLGATVPVGQFVTATATGPGNNTSECSQCVEIFPLEADLRLTLSDAPDPVRFGEPLTYTIEVTNQGPAPAAGVEIVDTLEPGQDFRSMSGICSRTGDVVTCDVGELASGESASVAVVIAAPLPGDISNTATVLATGGPVDPDLADNTVTVTTTVHAGTADLSLSVTDSPDPANEGELVNYIMLVTNHGPSPATDVTVSGLLPVGAPVQVPLPAGCTLAGNTFSCDLVGRLQPNVSVGTGIFVEAAVGVMSFEATAEANESDPNETDNTAVTASTIVTATADLEVAVQVAPDPVRAFELLTYVVTVTNNGPSPATGLSLNNRIDASAILESSPAACAVNGRDLACPIDTLGASASVAFQIQVYPTLEGTITNFAGLPAFDQFDPNNVNNNATDVTNVLPGETDVGVTIAESEDPIVAGEPVTYTLTVTNYGPSRANTELSYDLPDMLAVAPNNCTSGSVFFG